MTAAVRLGCWVPTTNSAMPGERLAGDHDWRFMDEHRAMEAHGFVAAEAPMARRWYCTRCRRVETTVG